MAARNPADFVDLPRQARKEMKALSVEEVDRFMTAAAADRWHVLFAFALATGMRPGEYLGLQWKDVDLRAGTVKVQRSLVREGKGWYFSEPKTARSRRTIPLPRTTVAMLADHKRQQAEERLAAGAGYANHDLVFATALGSPLGEQNLASRHFKPLLRAAGLPSDIRLYDLRHTCATMLMEAGENPKVVSERLGHATITLTLDTYSHVLPTMQREAASKLESLLFGAR
jgi:integrase